MQVAVRGMGTESMSHLRHFSPSYSSFTTDYSHLVCLQGRRGWQSELPEHSALLFEELLMSSTRQPGYSNTHMGTEEKLNSSLPVPAGPRYLGGRKAGIRG